MISKSAWLSNHIFHIDFDLLMHHIMEQGYHALLVNRLGILQTEWHDAVGTSPPMGVERYLGFVLFSHFDIIITRGTVHKGEENVGRDLINQGIDMWQGKIILQASPVQISIRNTHVNFPIFLRHGNNVCNPIRVGYDSKKFNYFSTSSLIFRIISDFILQRACRTRGHLGLTRILWTTISVSISWQVLIRPDKDFLEFLQ